MKYNFIEEYSIDKDLCKRLIEFFKSVPMGTNTPYYRKLQGQVGANQVIKSIKDSTDLTFSNKLILRIGDINILPQNAAASKAINDYVKALTACMIKFKIKYPYCIPDGSEVKLIEDISLQHYKPKGGYHRYHFERSADFKPISTRHLVFMTYLNTVTDKGGTEFYHQEITTDAVEGNTVIWSSDWTHTHRGVPSPTQDKYIITGLYNLVT